MTARIAAADACALEPDWVRQLLDRAVRIAARGHGGAEPNPMVGCVIANTDGAVVAEGFHRRCGGPHAEIEALRAAGARARGAVALVTLEPCAHRGRTGPCADALIDAGVSQVLYAVPDPNPLACGGAVRLREAGIVAGHVPHAGALELARPFLKRVTSGLPWVSAKWAQSVDGAIALANGDSKWLSCGRSRRMVHRERGRVDAILTGIGTVIEDDPQLTPRGVRVQRMPRRLVFDPGVEIPMESRLCDGTARTTLLVGAALDRAAEARLAMLQARGVDAVALGPGDRIEPALRSLASQGVATVLVEAGGGVVGRLVAEELLDEAWVFVAPLLVGDGLAQRAARGMERSILAEIPRGRLLAVRRRGEDALLQFRFGPV
jgi:diaminohydroxyphosphoribosylaminopyrimidine deaminase/5-amino-6-(5-phosphoribosylamino)uracil reductase